MAVDYRDTLITYLKSESLEDAAKNLNITKAALVARMGVLRKAGVKVPQKYKKSLTALDVAQLNAIINKHAKEVSAT